MLQPSLQRVMFMSQPHHDFSTAGALRLFAPVRGVGSPVLLMHGIYPGARRDEFEFNLDRLRGRFAVCAPDLPGFGESDAPPVTFTTPLFHHAMRDLIATHLGGPCAVVAVGASCAAAVRLAVYDDPLVEKLILICPQHRHDLLEHPTRTERISQFIHGTLRLGAGLYESLAEKPAVRSFVESRFHDPTRREIDGLVERIASDATRPNGMYPVLSLMNGYLDLDLYAMLRHVRAQTLILWGESLGEPPTELLRPPAAWSRGQHLRVVERTRLWPHVERPAVVDQQIIDFCHA
jgi:pimeloyl-ACP methyl ester carboxylesterase